MICSLIYNAKTSYTKRRSAVSRLLCKNYKIGSYRVLVKLVSIENHVCDVLYLHGFNVHV